MLDNQLSDTSRGKKFDALFLEIAGNALAQGSPQPMESHPKGTF